jgi:hypothetical protein
VIANLKSNIKLYDIEISSNRKALEQHAEKVDFVKTICSIFFSQGSLLTSLDDGNQLSRGKNQRADQDLQWIIK